MEALDEAGRALCDQMETQSQLIAQLELAGSTLDLDPDRSFQILGSAIDRMNVVLNAMETNFKFHQRQLIFDETVTNEEEKYLFPEEDISIYLYNSDFIEVVMSFERNDFDRTTQSFKKSKTRF